MRGSLEEHMLLWVEMVLSLACVDPKRGLDPFLKVDTLYTSIYHYLPRYALIYLYMSLYMPIYEHPVYKEEITVLSMHEEGAATSPYRQGALEERTRKVFCRNEKDRRERPREIEGESGEGKP